MIGQNRSPLHGRITQGIEPRTLVRQTIGFVCSQLPRWRDDTEREPAEAEEALNGQLCKFLNVVSRSEFPMAHFHHEERQAKRRRVDMSAMPVSDILIGHSKYEPFLVMEGKRLPAPSTDRKREYVVGNEQSSGGIERFKLGLHGGALETAAMVGYVQRGSFADCHGSINVWIAELSAQKKSSWTNDKPLSDLEMNAVDRVASCQSEHSRVDAVSPRIQLEHLWIDMTPAAA